MSDRSLLESELADVENNELALETISQLPFHDQGENAIRYYEKLRIVLVVALAVLNPGKSNFLFPLTFCVLKTLQSPFSWMWKSMSKDRKGRSRTSSLLPCKGVT